MASDKKTPQEASKLFHNSIKASVSPKATGAAKKKVKEQPKEPITKSMGGKGG